jgi:hypothetical protein
MGTLREYFETDFASLTNWAAEMTVTSGTITVQVLPRVHLDQLANAKFISCFVPAGTPAYMACRGVLEHAMEIVESQTGVQILDGHPGAEHPEELLDSTTLIFTKRIYFYVEDDLSTENLGVLRAIAATKGMSMHVRQQRYAQQRSGWETPLAFVCHDSRDKDQIARPIATGLSKLRCPIWYDEFSLKVGDRLRESIEKGLKECRKCILIVSQSFLSNSGWTHAEFNSIFTREILDKDDLILPVWHGVSPREVFEYSPSLADRVALDWSRGEEDVVRRLHHVLTRPTG